MKRVNLWSVLAFIALVTLSVGIVSCGDDDDYDGLSSETGFRLTEVGVRYATFEVDLDDLKRLYFEGMGIPYTPNINLSDYGIEESTFNSALRECFDIYVSETETGNFHTDNTKKISNGKVVFELTALCPGTKYYYRIYHPAADGKSTYDKTYSFSTKEWDYSSVSVTTGNADVQFNSYYLLNYVYVNDNLLTIHGLTKKDLDGISFVVACSADISDLGGR